MTNSLGSLPDLPGRGAEDLIEVLLHHLIEGRREPIARPPPFTHRLQAKGGRAQDRRIEILVGDRIAPNIELLQAILPRLIAGVQILDLIPEDQPESIEVRP